MNDTLAVVVNQVGIPILVRPYGQAQIPATAAIGIVGAIFDAALGSRRQVAYLETKQYRVTYRHTQDGWLLTLFNSELIPTRQSSQTLQWLDRMLHLVVRPSLFGSADSGSQKFEVAKHLAFVDYIMTHQSDLELAIGIPLVPSSNNQALDALSMGVPWAGPMYVVGDGVVLVDNEDSFINPLGAWLVVLLVIAAELILEQPSISTVQFPVFIDSKPHQMMVVALPSTKVLVWFGLTSGEIKIAADDVQKKLVDWHQVAASLLPPPWSMPIAMGEQWPAVLGYCLFRQDPSPRCAAAVAIKTTSTSPGSTQPKTTLLTEQHIYTLLGHGVHRLCHDYRPSTANEDIILAIGNNVVLMHAIRPPLHVVAVVAAPWDLASAMSLGDFLAQTAFAT